MSCEARPLPCFFGGFHVHNHQADFGGPGARRCPGGADVGNSGGASPGLLSAAAADGRSGGVPSLHRLQVRNSGVHSGLLPGAAVGLFPAHPDRQWPDRLSMVLRLPCGGSLPPPRRLPRGQGVILGPILQWSCWITHPVSYTKGRKASMKAIASRGIKTVGRFSVEFEVANYADMALVRRGLLTAKEVRRQTISGVVDCGAAMLVLPQSVVKQLGLHLKG